MEEVQNSRCLFSVNPDKDRQTPFVSVSTFKHSPLSSVFPHCQVLRIYYRQDLCEA